MTHADDIALMKSILFAEADTVEVSYEGVPIRAHFEYVSGSGDAPFAFCHALLEVNVDDVALPAYRDQVVYDGTTFRAAKGPNGEVVQEGTEISWVIFLSSNPKPVY